MDTAYLEFEVTPDTLNPDGTPQELNNIGLPMQVVRQVHIEGKTEIVEDLVGVRITPSASPKVGTRILPGTRIVATNSPAVVQALLSAGGYVLIDPPHGRSSRPAGRKRPPRKRTAPKKSAPAAPAAPTVPDPLDATVDPESKE